MGEINYDEFNTTELLAFAKHKDVRGATRATPREVIIDAIHNNHDVDDDSRLIEMREELSSYLKSFWDTKFQMQARHSSCPNCETCSDFLLVVCHHANKDGMTLWKKRKDSV